MNKSIVLCGMAILASTLQVSAHEEQTTPPPQNTMRVGYLPSANYLKDDINVFVTADYILWKWDQALATTDLLTTSDSFDDQFISRESKLCLFDPKYQSGFQVGLGLSMHNVDDWNIYAEYTWFRSQNDSILQTAPDQAFRRYYGDQFLGYYQQGYFRKQGSLAFNDFDVTLQKSFYLSRMLTACFSTGIKNLWTNMHLDTNYEAVLKRFNTPEINVTNSVGKSSQRAYGLGPKFGFSFDWIFGYGIKLAGEISASMLYNHYTWKGNVAADLSGKTFTSTFTKPNKNNYLSPIMETSFGLAWGSYLYNNTYHIDLSASYDFNTYWNYTRLGQRFFTDVHLSGLNLKARFDF